MYYLFIELCAHLFGIPQSHARLWGPFPQRGSARSAPITPAGCGLPGADKRTAQLAGACCSSHLKSRRRATHPRFLKRSEGFGSSSVLTKARRISATLRGTQILHHVSASTALNRAGQDSCVLSWEAVNSLECPSHVLLGYCFSSCSLLCLADPHKG